MPDDGRKSQSHMLNCALMKRAHPSTVPAKFRHDPGKVDTSFPIRIMPKRKDGNANARPR